MKDYINDLDNLISISQDMFYMLRKYGMNTADVEAVVTHLKKKIIEAEIELDNVAVDKENIEAKKFNYNGYVLDPPSGWQFGFPAVCEEDVTTKEEMENWLLKMGYPQKMIDSGMANFIRCWKDE